MLNESKYNSKQPLPSPSEERRFTDAVKSLPFSRYYALSSEALRSGVSLLRSALLLNEQVTQSDFVALLLVVSEMELSLVQSWRLDKAPPSPRLWLDEVTGLPLPNPWSLSSLDRTAQGFLAERDPVLAAYLEATSTVAGAYELAARRQDEASRRAEFARIDYGEKDHHDNPFRLRTPTASVEQANFSRTQPEAVVSVWKAEANDVSLPWSAASTHRSNCGKIIERLNKKPSTLGDGDLVLLSMKIDRLILDTAREAASDAAAEASRRANELAGYPKRELASSLPK